MNLSVAQQNNNLFGRYDLIAGMNGLKNNAIIDQYIGPGSFCPVRPTNTKNIKIDHATGPGDLPMAHGPLEDVNEVIIGAVGQREIVAPHWRGKFSVDEDTISEMRNIGQPPTSRGRVGYQAIRDRVVWARRVTDARMAKAACDALYGTLDLNYQDGKKITFNYEHTSQLRLDLTDAGETRDEWTNRAGATPIDDIAEMKQRLREFGAMDPAILLMGGNVYRNLLQSQDYKDYVQRTNEGISITARMDLPTSTFCDLTPVVAKGTYPIIDRITATVAATATTVTLLNGADGTFGSLKAGDKVVFKLSTATANQEAEVLATVASISGKTLTLNAAIGKAFQPGDQVVWNRPFIGWNDCFILPMSNPGEWMQWSVAQSIHADFRSMRWAKIVQQSEVPERYGVFFGVDGIPVYITKNQHAYIKTA